ncbi:hypothetical protein AB0C15_01495 [Micromonospora sp. NPDC048835]
MSAAMVTVAWSDVAVMSYRVAASVRAVEVDECRLARCGRELEPGIVQN